MLSFHPMTFIHHYDAFLLDAFGVFWGSGEVLPGSKEAMKSLVDQGKKVGILSNSTGLVAAEKAKFSKHGLEEEIHYHFLLTSGEILRRYLTLENLPFPTPKKRYALYGAPHPALFEGTSYTQVSLDEADFIYISTPLIDDEREEAFQESVTKMAHRKIPVLCANPDKFVQSGNPPRYIVRQGTIAELFKAQGLSVHYFGKPAPFVFDAAISQFPKNIQRNRILMIGDTPETDIYGAKQSGIHAALVTKTGVTYERLKRDPNYLTSLPDTHQPNFLIDRFAIDGI